MPTHLDWSSFTGPGLTHADWSLLLSGVDHYLCHPSQLLLLSPFVQFLSEFLCPTLWLAFPSYFQSRRYLESKPFVWFRAKTNKGIVCLADHLHSVTYVWVCEVKKIWKFFQNYIFEKILVCVIDYICMYKSKLIALCTVYCCVVSCSMSLEVY